MVAKIFFGNKEVLRDNLQDRINPWTQQVVSKYPLCDKNDTKKVLQIAKEAFKNTRKSKLSQRINWLEDVANRLALQKDDIAKTICDEVGKPIAFAKVEVDRCIETIKLSISAMIELNGETIHTDATNSGKKTLSFYQREPIGVISCITPFNFHLIL